VAAAPPPPAPAAPSAAAAVQQTIAQRIPTRPAIAAARLRHAESGTEFTLQDINVIGRFDRTSGYTPEVDLSSLDTKRTLSRRHASITRDADGWHLSEPKPTGNGTFVNEARVGAGAKIKLADGDRVRFGLVETVFREA